MSEQVHAREDYTLAAPVRRWLEADEPDDLQESADECFERWLESRERGVGVLKLGRVWVDEPVLHARFDCVAERCVEGTRKGGRKWCSCCTDVYVSLSAAEHRRLGKMSKELSEYLAPREPRLRPSMDVGNERAFWLDANGDALCQPGGRCVFSMMDSSGRIRCHLHPFAESMGIARSEIQPYTCRVFPLLVIQMQHDRVLLSVLNKDNYRAWDTYPPWRYPCLCDKRLPPLVKSMASTLDWMFGPGFAETLQAHAKV